MVSLLEQHDIFGVIVIVIYLYKYRWILRLFIIAWRIWQLAT